MKFGIWLPFSYAQWVTQMARLAERSGWDGVFLRERVVGLDRWIPIASAALGTHKILIGGVISPASSETLQPILNEAYRIHRRSGKRLVVCLGKWFPEDGPNHPDGVISPESIDSHGEPWNDGDNAAWFTHQLAVWRIGIWPNHDSILDTLSHQGVIPVIRQGDGSMRAPTQEEIKQIVAFIRQSARSDEPFEVVIEAALEEYQPKLLLDQSKAWEAAGATWWIINYGRSVDGAQGINRLAEIITRGPPD